MEKESKKEDKEEEAVAIGENEDKFEEVKWNTGDEEAASKN